MRIFICLLLCSVSALAQVPYVSAPTNSPVNGYTVQRTGDRNKWVPSAGGDSLWGTNAPDGGITNVNSAFGSANVGGTNAVLKLDTGTNQNWLVDGRTNGATNYKVRSDGSVFVGENVGQDQNVDDFSKRGFFAVSMVDSNEPPYIQNYGVVLDSENYGFYADYNFQAIGGKDQSTSGLSLDTGQTNGNSVTWELVSDSLLFNNSHFFLKVNNVRQFQISESGDLSTIKSVAYSWPSAHGPANSVLTDTDGSGTLAWSNILASTGFSNEVRSISTNTFFGNGHTNYVARFTPNTNTMGDSHVVENATNEWSFNLPSSGSANTNAWTNHLYGEWTSANNWQRMDLVGSPAGQNIYDELRSSRGSGDSRAQNKFLLWQSWIVNGIGTGSAPDGAGHWLPIADNLLDVGSGSLRVRRFTFGDVCIGTPSDSQAIFTDSAGGGHGFGIGTAGTLYFSGPGFLSFQYNRERNSGTAQLDVSGSLLGFGGSISNSIAYLQGSTRTGLIGIGTNSSVASPTAVGFVGAPATGTDHGASDVIIAGGLSSGTGTSGAVRFQTVESAASTSSSVNTSLKDREYIASKVVTLTESSATLIFNVALASGKFCGLRVMATTDADDGTDFQALSETIAIAAVNKASTITTVVSASVPSAMAASAGTLANTWTAVQNGSSVDVKLSSVSSLTQTTLRVRYRVELDGDGTLVVTP